MVKGGKEQIREK
jgi:hypothetical protein